MEKVSIFQILFHSSIITIFQSCCSSLLFSIILGSYFFSKCLSAGSLAISLFNIWSSRCFMSSNFHFLFYYKHVLGFFFPGHFPFPKLLSSLSFHSTIRKWFSILELFCFCMSLNSFICKIMDPKSFNAFKFFYLSFWIFIFLFFFILMLSGLVFMKRKL